MAVNDCRFCDSGEHVWLYSRCVNLVFEEPFLILINSEKRSMGGQASMRLSYCPICGRRLKAINER